MLTVSIFGYIFHMDIEISLQNALHLFESGNTEACSAICREVLTTDARHPKALLLLGLSYHQSGQTATAAEFLGQAQEISPFDPIIVYNYGLTLLALNRADEAQAILTSLVERFPEVAEANFLLGNALTSRGRHADAVSLYQRATSLRPDYLDAWHNLGITLKQLGEFAEATKAFQQALAIDPSHSSSLFQLGQTRYSQGAPQDAIDSLRKLLDINPDDGLTCLNLGILLLESQKVEEALHWLKKAARLMPQEAAVYNSLGQALLESGHLIEAKATLQQALTLDPSYPEAYSNLGNALFDSGRFHEAIDQFKQALALNDQLHQAWYNLGKCHHELLDLDQTINSYRQAITLKPDLAEAHWNLSHALLLIGRYDEGFKEYLWRWRREAAQKNDIPKPEWQGEKEPGQTLLVHTEQGMGDSIQFARYLPLVRARVGKLFLACDPPLIPLMQSLAGVDAILNKENLAPLYHAFNLQVPLLNLPSIFTTSEASIPVTVPYLSPDQRSVTEFAPLFTPATGTFKIGLVWRGNPAHTNDANRSCRLTDLTPLFDRPGATFYSLQLNGEELPTGMTDLAPHLHSFADTAAMLSHLDLLISVDTSIAHLAGALAKPVWLLLPYVPEWRWGLNSQTSPWYPTMQIFRQTERGNWKGVINLVRSALDAPQA